MAPDDHSGAKPAGPVVLRIKLRYDDLDAMVQRFASNVGRSGLFLPTRTMQPLGTEVKFELRLANDTPVLVGLGRVKHVRPPDPANPRAAFGMAIELMRVTREGREVIIRMIERRRVLGLPDVAIPLPEDVESARRADMDSQPRADTSGIVREAMAQMASAPVAEQILTARPATGPIATAKLESGPITRPATFAAPRESGPISKPAVAALAPEPPRKPRPRLDDLIAEAESGPIAAGPPELDEHVDVERALARARVLATGDLDVELAALRESAAAPIEISIEAASAELARQLGGTPIAPRDRSARWAPPPAVTAVRGAFVPSEVPATAGAALASEPALSSEAAPTSEISPAGEAVRAISEPALPLDAADDDDRADNDDRADDDDAFGADAAGATTAVEPVESARRTFAPPGADDIATDPAAPPRPPAVVVAEHPPEQDDEEDAELAAFERAVDSAIVHTGQSKAAPPAEADENEDNNEGEIEELDSLDVVPDDEPSEATQIGAMPVDPNAFHQHGQPTEPAAYVAEDAYAQPHDAYAQPHDAYAQPHVEYAQPHGEYAQPHGAYAQPHDAYAQPHDPYAPAHDAYAPGEQPAYGEPSAYGEHAAYAAPAAYAEPGYDGHGEFEQGEYSAQAPEDEEEISDIDVLAEADAEDADLLTAHGEQEASGQGAAAPAASVDGAYDFDRDYEAPDGVPPAREFGAQPSYPPPAGEGSFDFAARLDLGDDESNHARPAVRPIDPRRARSYGDGYDDGAPSYADSRREPSYGEERYDYDAPSSSYTFAESDQDPYGEGAPAQLTPIASPPLPQPSVLRAPPPPDFDLENALEALDVDLDELSPAVREHRAPLPGLPTPHPGTGPVRAASEIDTSRPRGKVATPARALATAKPAKPKRAATEDDGVLIDFDDDDE